MGSDALRAYSKAVGEIWSVIAGSDALKAVVAGSDAFRTCSKTNLVLGPVAQLVARGVVQHFLVVFCVEPTSFQPVGHQITNTRLRDVAKRMFDEWNSF